MDGTAKPMTIGRDLFRQLLAPEWLPIVVGMLAMFVPLFYSLAHGIWATEEQAHGPIILALAGWLIVRSWPQLMQLPALAVRRSSLPLGWLLAILAMLLYILGRTQQIASFDISSFVVMLAAILLLKWGGAGMKVLWFPFFFMLFMIPLPSAVVSMLTLPMKTAVSYVTEHLLFWMGFPIARTGVILQIGQYQLLVADACAGLQTLLTLESLGLFYLNVVRHTSAFRNIALALLIIPISFTANVIRVCALTLITYFFGDAAGQGFLHGFAGMLLFISALVLIIGVDSVLQLIVKKRAAQAQGAQP